ncbi:MAG TPA: AAA family ATPase, partial [Gaiellaceae bacterium]|nr:AAA family ATPase [Gaiellaceae bacterium]
TSLAAALDPEVLRAVLRRYFDTVRTIVERHGGTIEKFMGDAALAVFGVPQTHEEDALRAVRAARDLHEALIALNSELGREHGLELRVRIGINTGEVLTGDAAAGQPFATGVAVNVAMRLQQAALPGETLLGAATQALLGEGAEVEPIEPIEARGAHDPIRAFRLLALDEGAPLRRLSSGAFIGREGELEALESAFRAVRDERRSRTLIVLGEAGLGKTRLASELVASLAEQPSALVGRCVSYGEGATYLPLAEIVRQVAPERPQATVERLLEGDEHAAAVAERIAELTGQTEGTAATGELFWAMRRLLEGLARRSPLVVVLEDLHWAEPTLLDFVEYLAAWPVEAPLLLVCLARPELRDERPGLSAEAEVLRLEPLEDAAVDLLVGELGGAEVGAETRRRIASLAEGNPLFVEQLLAFLDEAGPEALESVPPSVEALLASRLDRLEPDERALLERGAVVGREFARGAAVHLTPPDELTGIDRRLRALASRSLIHAVRADREHDDSFRFHHVLVRDVAYAGITKERRADLHERHGAWLDTRDEPDELVGYHAERAHLYRRDLQPSDPGLGRLASWAGDRLAAAGIRAWKRADTPATVNLLGRATALLSADDAKRVELLCELGMAQKGSGDFERGEATLVEAVQAASLARDRRMGLRAEIELAHLHLFSDPEGASAELLG